MQVLANIYSCMSSAQNTPNIFKIFTDNSQQYVENNKYLFFNRISDFVSAFYLLLYNNHRHCKLYRIQNLCYALKLYWVRINVRSVWARDFVTHVTEIYDIYRCILEDEISRRLSISLACEL